MLDCDTQAQEVAADASTVGSLCGVEGVGRTEGVAWLADAAVPAAAVPSASLLHNLPGNLDWTVLGHTLHCKQVAAHFEEVILQQKMHLLICIQVCSWNVHLHISLYESRPQMSESADCFGNACRHAANASKCAKDVSHVCYSLQGSGHSKEVEMVVWLYCVGICCKPGLLSCMPASCPVACMAPKVLA